MARKILVVDDTKLWQMFHKDLIKSLYGDLFDITFASSAKEALGIIRRSDVLFDIILTDLQMELDYDPLMAGEWLVSQIKQMKEWVRVPVVIISAMNNIDFIAKKYDVDCISKNLLVNNKLIFKFMFEKLLPFLNKI